MAAGHVTLHLGESLHALVERLTALLFSCATPSMPSALSIMRPRPCHPPLASRQRVQEQEAGQQDGQELAGSHDGGKNECTKGLDGVGNEQGTCREGQRVVLGSCYCGRLTCKHGRSGHAWVCSIWRPVSD